MKKNRIIEIVFAAVIIVSVTAAARADRGYYTECGTADGYRGCVTVFNKSGAPVYRWYSAEDYIVSADVSDNGKHLAVACECGCRGRVHIFRLDSTAEQGCFDCKDVIVDAVYLRNKLCALSEHGAYFVTDMGNLRKHVKFGGYLGEYNIENGKLSAEVRKYLSGGTIKEINLG